MEKYKNECILIFSRLYLIFPPPYARTRKYTNIHLFSYSRHSIYADVVYLYTFFVFECLHLLSGFFCSFNWNVYFTLILVNISPGSYRSMCVCDCMCFPVALRGPCMRLDSINAIIGKGSQTQTNVKKRKSNYGKQEFLTRFANKRCRLKNFTKQENPIGEKAAYKP